MLADILGKGELHSLGFDIPRGKLTARQAVMLNKVKEELPSESDITKADDIELQEIARSTEDLIVQMKHDQSQTDEPFEYPLRELLGLDKQLRSIRGLLKVKEFSWKKASKKRTASSKNSETILEFTICNERRHYEVNRRSE